MSDERRVDRRAFLGRLPVIPAAAAVLTSSTTGCAGIPMIAGTPTAGGIAVPRLAFGESPDIVVEVPGSRFPVYVRRSGSDYTAVSLRCTHRGCQPEPEVDRLTCPCHGSEFRFDGRVIQGPAEEPLESFATRIQGETLLLEARPEAGS